MDKYVVLVLVLTSIIGFQVIVSSGNGFFHTKVPKLDYFKGYCRGHENAPIQFKNIHIKTTHNENYISGNVIVEQDNFTEIQLIVKTQRCASKEALDSCEPMKDITIDKICMTLNQANQVWSPFIKSIQPPMECPAKNGTYTIRNGTFDLGPLINFPGVEQSYWKERVEAYQQNTNILVSCLILEGHVTVN